LAAERILRSHPSPAPIVPDRIPQLNSALQGRYAFVRVLGEGGMATVYLARDVRHDREVAVKILKPEVVAAVGSERFLNEIRFTAGLRHPNILPLYDSGEADGFLFYVMPYVGGESLAERLAARGPLPVDEALRITREVAGALACAHEKRIVHRDVKPGNILFEAGQAMVTDFGVARVVDSVASTKLTSTGIAVGTPLYMSPEQATGSQDVTPASDLYSLACVLYEMLAGEPPYTGPTTRMVTVKRLTDPVPSVRRLRGATPVHVDEALIKALQKVPVDRFETANELMEALAAPSTVTTVGSGSETGPGDALSGSETGPGDALSGRETGYVDARSERSVGEWGERYEVVADGGQPGRSTPVGGRSTPAGGDWAPPGGDGSPGDVTAGRGRAAAGRSAAWWRRPYAAAGGLVALAVIVLLVASLWPTGGEIPPLGEPALARVTRGVGAELFPSLTPDGSRVVYSGGGDLFVRTLDTGDELRLTDRAEDDNTQPTFSPDGRLVAFRSNRNGGGIFVIGAGGGEVRQLTNFGHNPAWSPDGTRILFASEGVTDPSTRRTLSNLFTVEVESGEQRRLGDIDAVQPSWSSDGSRIAFWSVMRDGQLTSQRDIWTMRSDGTEPVRVTDDRAVDWSPAWSSDGTHLLFSSDRGGNMNLWSLPIDSTSGGASGPPQQVTSGGTTSHEQISVAASGLALYVEKLTTSNIFRIGVDPETGALIGEPAPVTSGSLMATEPSVSPDGSAVVFYTLDGAMDLYVASADGSELRRLTDGSSHDRSPQWSPDGQRIAFHSDRTGAYQIWSTDAAATELTRLTTSGVHTIYPFWSPDSRSVGFVELGRGVSVVDLSTPGSAEMLIAGDLMVRPAWSPDRSRIAGVLPPTAGGTGIVVYSLASRAIETVSDFGDAPQWFPDGRRLVFAWGSRLYLADVDAGRVRELGSFAPHAVGLGSVSPDGRWLYYSMSVTEADLWSIEWR
jgi:Tol biopolymer transport system component